MLIYAANGGNVECIKWAFANTTIDVNSTNNYGVTALFSAVFYDRLEAAKFLVEKGANPFIKTDDGVRAIDMHTRNDPDNDALGPQVLQHARDLRWSSVKLLLLTASACSSPAESDPPPSPTRFVKQRTLRRRALREAQRASRGAVLGNADLVRHIAGFFIDPTIILADPTIKRSDAVKVRVEATLAAALAGTSLGPASDAAASSE